MVVSHAHNRTIYFGRFIDTPTADGVRVRVGAVLVDRNDGYGLIENEVWGLERMLEVHEKLGVSKNINIVTCPPDGFFFPGFVDTHIHAPQYPNCGIFGKSTLLEWLTTYTFPLESSLGSENSPMYQDSGSPGRLVDPLARARQVYERVISRTLSYGTTTASYFATIHVPATKLLADLAFRIGQRAYIGHVCMDHPDTCPAYYRDGGPDESLANTIANIEHCRQLDPSGELVAPIITPRFAPSCQTETLSRLGELAQKKLLRIQTHLSENLDELKLVRNMFPDRSSYTDVYDHYGLLTDRTILAHGIHLSDEELAVIHARGSKISHCPASNTAIGSGLCPVRRLLDQGIDVGLGSDISGGYSCSILEAVRQCCLVSRQLGYLHGQDSRWNIGVAESLWLGTVGGAKCTGLGEKAGVFEVGVLWDVQEIQLSQGPVDLFGWESWEERVDKWVWNGDDRNVKRVWVGGRLVHENRGLRGSLSRSSTETEPLS